MDFIGFEEEVEDRSKKPRKQGRAPINKNTKLNLVFDPNARRRFLTGFRKRKAERKVQYQEKLHKDLAEEKIKMREEAKKKVTKKQSSSHSILPEVEHLIDSDASSASSDSEFEETFDLGTTTVQISSLDDAVHPKLETLKREEEEEASDFEEDAELAKDPARAFLTYKRRRDFATSGLQTTDNTISTKLRKLFKPSVEAAAAAKTETLVRKETTRLLQKSDIFKKALKFKQQHSKKFRLNRYQPGARGGKHNKNAPETPAATPTNTKGAPSGGGGHKKNKIKVKTRGK